jgi:hypothetical protein
MTDHKRNEVLKTGNKIIIIKISSSSSSSKSSGHVWKITWKPNRKTAALI